MQSAIVDSSLPSSLARWTLWLRSRRDRLKFLEDMASRGDVVRATIGPWTVHFVTHPDLIKELLVNQARKVVKGLGLQRARRVLGNGLVTSEGEVHHRQRRLSQPAFHRQRLLGYGASMVELSARYRDSLRDGEERDMHVEMMRLTLAVVGKTLFGADIEGDAFEIGEALGDFIRSFNFMLLPFYEYFEKLPLGPIRRVTNARNRLDRIIYRLVSQRRQSGRDHGDLLSMLMAATDSESDGSGMSDEQLRDECVTLLLAGHETTANALTWALYLLSQNPAVETRLLAEIDRVLGDRLPTVADLPELAYVEQVVAESLRLYPPVFSIARLIVEPVSFEGYTLPAGTLALIPIWAIHRLPRYYADPSRFDPDRFTPEARAARPRYSYMPFSHGPRNCIGEHFAWMEAVLMLSTLLQRFQFRLVPGQSVELSPMLTLRSKHGMRLRVCARAPKKAANPPLPC